MMKINPKILVDVIQSVAILILGVAFIIHLVTHIIKREE